MIGDDVEHPSKSHDALFYIEENGTSFLVVLEFKSPPLHHDFITYLK